MERSGMQKMFLVFVGTFQGKNMVCDDAFSHLYDALHLQQWLEYECGLVSFIRHGF